MNYFKCPDNKPHALSDEDIENGGMDLLPKGCVKVTEQEALSLVKISEEQAILNARSDRDAKLAATDFYFFADYPITVEQLNSVKEYRKNLRDIPTQDGFPRNIDWPVLKI